MLLSFAQFLVNGLKLVCPPKGDKLDVLIGQADLCGGTRLEGVARTAVTADKYFIVCYLPHTDVQLALVRKLNVCVGQVADDEVFISCDGGTGYPLKAGATAEIRLSDQNVKLITFGRADQFQAIDQKLRKRQ